MEINKIILEGIFDTGSNINIISKDAWQRAAQWPMNMKYGITMKDANKSKRYLPELFANILLQCGNIQTYTDLFITPHVSFELLLSRAWQETNLVALNEMQDSTYLLFKDLGDSNEILHQFFVGPYQGPSINMVGANEAAKNNKIGQVNKVDAGNGIEKESSPHNKSLRTK